MPEQHATLELTSFCLHLQLLLWRWLYCLAATMPHCHTPPILPPSQRWLSGSFVVGSCATHWIRVGGGWFWGSRGTKTNQGGGVIVARPLLEWKVFATALHNAPPLFCWPQLLPGPLNANTSFGHPKRWGKRELSISARMGNQLWPGFGPGAPNKVS